MKSKILTQQANGGAKDKRISKEIQHKKKIARAQDLSTRERVNFVISTSIMNELRDKSSKEEIPMSRMVDTALLHYLNADTEVSQLATLESGISLYHNLEILLYQSFASEFTKNLIHLMQTHLTYFTYTSCLLKTPSNESIVGAKLFSYVADSQQMDLSELLNENLLLDNKQFIRIALDSKPILL